jgi:hypothetical protein
MASLNGGPLPGICCDRGRVRYQTLPLRHSSHGRDRGQDRYDGAPIGWRFREGMRNSRNTGHKAKYKAIAGDNRTTVGVLCE